MRSEGRVRLGLKEAPPRPSGQRLGLIKGGQLGRMLIQAAIPYGLSCSVLDPDPEAPCRSVCRDFVVGDPLVFSDVYQFGKSVDVLTLEFEHVDAAALERLEAEGVTVAPHASVIRLIQDKGLQKEFYRSQGLPIAPFLLLENKRELLEQRAFLPAIQKTRRAGYDGKGVVTLRSPSDYALAFDVPSVLERLMPIAQELSVLVARSRSGAMVTYPVIEMVFHPHQHLVDYLVAPAAISSQVERRALEIARTIAEALDIVGMLAVELFVCRDGEVVVNEIAPRPHNSGHHTIEANRTSQFSQHLRAIFDWPLGSTEMLSACVLVNVLGAPGHTGPARVEGLARLLEAQDMIVHLYGKATTQPFRKRRCGW